MKKFLLPLAFAAALLVVPVAQAAPVIFTALLNGPSESPVNTSPGTGFATVIFDPILHTMSLSVSFSGLVTLTSTGLPSGATAAHIHCCTAVAGAGTVGVATETPTFGGFPLGVTSGAYTNLYDLTLPASFNTAFIAGNGGTTASAEAALLAGTIADKAYFNIHTNAFSGGEIRGFLIPAQSVSEPESLALLALALVGVAVASKRKCKGTNRVTDCS